MPKAPTILLFDSGLGGLTVFQEVRAARADANFIYVADDAGFPYGNLDEDRLIERVVDVAGRAIFGQQSRSLWWWPATPRPRLRLANYARTFACVSSARSPRSSQLAHNRRQNALPYSARRQPSRANIPMHLSANSVSGATCTWSARHGSPPAPKPSRRRPRRRRSNRRRNSALFHRQGREAHGYNRARLHTLSASARALPYKCTLAGHLARPRTGHCAPGGGSDAHAPERGIAGFTAYRFYVRTSALARARRLACTLRVLAENMRLDFPKSAPDHLDRDINNDRKAQIGDPPVPVQQPGDESRGDAHQDD